MKTASESEFESYNNACQFIKNRMDKWIAECRLSLQDIEKSEKRSRYIFNRYGVKYLAEALHCLQDSFPPAHVVRSFKPRVQVLCQDEAIIRGRDIGNS